MFLYLVPSEQTASSYEKNKKGESYCKTNNVIKKEKLLLKRNHRLTNIRKNYLNQTISEIVNRKPRFICIEDLNVSGMMKNRHLSKAVQEQGFFRFRQQLEYKCNDKGIQLIVADRFYPSSKLCSCCGNIKKDLKLSDREYRCECGNIIDRDFQASINLKGYGERFASWHWNVNANMYGYVSPEFTPMESTITIIHWYLKRKSHQFTILKGCLFCITFTRQRRANISSCLSASAFRARRNKIVNMFPHWNSHR